MISYDDIETFRGDVAFLTEFEADIDADFTDSSGTLPPMSSEGFSQPMTDWDYEDGEQP